eukprot:7918606-Karenia_brevis.AAC.1
MANRPSRLLKQEPTSSAQSITLPRPDFDIRVSKSWAMGSIPKMKSNEAKGQPWITPDVIQQKIWVEP